MSAAIGQPLEFADVVLVVETLDEPARFLLISGKAIKEPVAWHGPIVMNTQDEIRTALRELHDGSFIRS